MMARLCADLADRLPGDGAVHAECKKTLGAGGGSCTCHVEVCPLVATPGEEGIASATSTRNSARLSSVASGGSGGSGSTGASGSAARVCFCSTSPMAAKQGVHCKYGADGTVDEARGDDRRRVLKRVGQVQKLGWWEHAQTLQDYVAFGNPPGLLEEPPDEQAAIDHVKALTMYVRMACAQRPAGPPPLRAS